MKILIIGASGFIGTKLFEILSKRYEVIGTHSDSEEIENLEKLDITSESDVKELIEKENPEIIINCAAIIDLIKCELNYEKVEKVNVLGVRNIVNACLGKKIKLIQLSSSYIFDGEKGNYSESDMPKPKNAYGASKLKGEKEALNLKNSIILRLDVPYGFNGKDKNNGFLNKILEGKKSVVNNEQIRHPILIDDIAMAIEILIEKNASGIFHLAGKDKLTKYDLTLKLKDILNKDAEVSPISGGIIDLKNGKKVIMPQNVSFDVSKALNLGIKFNSIEEGLEIIKKQLEKEEI